MEKILEALEDAEDLKTLNKAIEENEGEDTYTHEEVINALENDNLESLL